MVRTYQQRNHLQRYLSTQRLINKVETTQMWKHTIKQQLPNEHSIKRVIE